MKQIEVKYADGTTETETFVNNLYDLSWKDYRPIEKTIKMNAQLDRDGEILSIQIDDDDFIIEFQEAIAKAVLQSQDISLNEVNVSTVKKLIREYGDDHEELNVKLKKNQEESEG